MVEAVPAPNHFTFRCELDDLVAHHPLRPPRRSGVSLARVVVFDATRHGIERQEIAVGQCIGLVVQRHRLYRDSTWWHRGRPQGSTPATQFASQPVDLDRAVSCRVKEQVTVLQCSHTGNPCRAAVEPHDLAVLVKRQDQTPVGGESTLLGCHPM